MVSKELSIGGMVLLGVLIVVGIMLALKGLSNEDDWICDNGEWVKHGNPSSEMPSYSCSGNSDGNLIGGQRDDKGCLGPAGYSWNETEQECVREWIKDSPERYQVDSFRECAEAGYPVMESYPRQCSTPSGRTFTEEL